MADPAACLIDDLFLDIVSRLPVKSLCRAKRVSRRWRGLISHPDHCRRLPQTLAGFFHRTSVTGVDRGDSPIFGKHNGLPWSVAHFPSCPGMRMLLGLSPGSLDAGSTQVSIS
ncbi:hypothetical protein C2845_PM15G03870 [Panicum miliaceum]|uniref:F-box domain-containing protein n=1 Tax=Panicum miliaceum TaxID=4540 RepID=A0A3L6Q9V4_PANMI|nr:hypothetical protein C2845_PM15G03870 [Panicum miliaceum]